MALSIVVGYLLAVVSSFFNGIFASPSRLRRVENTNIHPLVFNVYVCVGVFLSSLVALPLTAGIKSEPFAFPPQGLLAGTLLVLAFAFSFLAIQRVGLSVGQAVWGGSAVIVSFLWGSLGPDQVGSKPKSVGLSVVAVLMIVVGIVTAVVSSEVSRRMDNANANAREAGSEYMKECEAAHAAPNESTKILAADDADDDEAKVKDEKGLSSSTLSNVAIGVVFAASVGIFGGSVLVPIKFLPKSQQQLAFLPAFGIGALVSCLIILGFFAAFNRKLPDMHPRQCAGPGILSGILWNLGNYASTFAQSPDAGNLSYAIAYPILQSAVIFSGIIGILVFKEIKGRLPIGLFALAVSIIIGGCVMLGLFGPQSAADDDAAITNTTNTTKTTIYSL